MIQIRLQRITLNRSHWQLLVTLIGLGGLIFTIAKSREIDLDRHQQYRDTIAQLQQKESDLNQIVLNARYELYVSYDPLVENLNSQKQIQQQLENIPNFLGRKERQEIQELLKERETLLTQKESLSEWFKSQNSLLKNSLRYLPLLASQLEEKVTNERETTSLEGTPSNSSLTSLRIIFNDLLRNLLLYNITTNENLEPAIKQQIVQLSQLNEQDKISDREFPIQLAVSHANIILTQKPQVEELTSQLLISAPQQTLDLANLYKISYQKARHSVDTYRFLRAGLFFILLIWIDYLFLDRFSRFRQNNAQSNTIKARTKEIQNSPSLELSAEQTEIVEFEARSMRSPQITEEIPDEIEEIDREKNLEQDNLREEKQEREFAEPIHEEFNEKKDLKEKIEEDISIEAEREQPKTDKIEVNDRLLEEVSCDKNELQEDSKSRKLLDEKVEFLVKTKAALDEENSKNIEANMSINANSHVEIDKHESPNVIFLEVKEEKPLDSQKSLQIDESANGVQSNSCHAIAKPKFFSSDSKNRHPWIRKVDWEASTLLSKIQSHIQQKTCKIWLDRFDLFRKDRLAQFKRKKDKIKIKLTTVFKKKSLRN